jgi:nicotinamidase-related amidase
MTSTHEERNATPVWVTEWLETLQPLMIGEAIRDPGTTAVVSTDMIVGFCREGVLASERVGLLETPVAELFTRCYEAGVRNFLLTQDTHHPETPEFEAWPPHCIAGTQESETTPGLARLPFADIFQVFEKNSLSPAYCTDFEEWLETHPDVRTMIIAGNCTDLCVYQLAMYLRLRANALNLHGYDVIVPANCVDTFDHPGDLARVTGAFTHPADFYHEVFLHHMALNGVHVVAEITAS